MSAGVISEPAERQKGEIRVINPNSEVKKHRFVRKAVAERGCDTKSNLNPRTKQCSQSFTRFSVPAKFNYAAP